MNRGWNTTKGKRVKRVKSDDIKSIVLAWTGTLGTWFFIQQLQVLIGLTAGLLTCIYTAMKIWDWVKTHRE